MTVPLDPAVADEYLRTRVVSRLKWTGRPDTHTVHARA
jgi:hypothetical protein